MQGKENEEESREREPDAKDNIRERGRRRFRAHETVCSVPLTLNKPIVKSISVKEL